MNKQQEIKAAIQAVVQARMDRVMEKVLSKDPFLPEVHHASEPPYAALVPDEIFRAAHFERRFVTPFRNIWERLAVVVATKGLEEQKKIAGLMA